MITPGTRLAPYEIVSLLSNGGIGEAYRGRDTKLNRGVALKILPEAFALDGDRIARFRRPACQMNAEKSLCDAQFHPV